MAYHLNDGNIIDDLNGNPNGNLNKWRSGGKVIKAEGPITIRVNINMDKSKITWWKSG